MNFQRLWENAIDYAAKYGWNVVYAVIILILGYFIAKVIRNGVRKMMDRRKLDATLASFVSNFIYAALIAFIALASLNRIGIETTSFVAIIGAAGLAIGFALQGSLSNFAAGFLLIIFRPFKAGDFVEAGGTTGVVSEVTIFTTLLKTPDNVIIIVPNAKILGDTIKNYSREELRRVDLSITITYSDDLPKAKAALMELVQAEDRVLKEPAPAVIVTDLAETGVKFAVRSWVKNADYWGVYSDLLEKIRIRFGQEGFAAPFQLRNIHLIQENKD